MNSSVLTAINCILTYTCGFMLDSFLSHEMSSIHVTDLWTVCKSPMYIENL